MSEKMEPGALESHDAACQDDTHAKGHEGSSGRSTEDEVVASKRTGIVLVRLQKATCVASKNGTLPVLRACFGTLDVFSSFHVAWPVDGAERFCARCSICGGVHPFGTG